MPGNRDILGRTVDERKPLLAASLTRSDNVNRLLAKNSPPVLSGLRHQTRA
jgi:Flp pilus assembly CpaF family ATPase